MMGCMVMIEAPHEAADRADRVGDADAGAGCVDPFVQMALVNGAVTDLMGADVGSLDDGWFARYVKSLDELRSQVDALVVDAAGECERRGHDRLRSHLRRAEGRLGRAASFYGHRSRALSRHVA
jgi:hypothetical protein